MSSAFNEVNFLKKLDHVTPTQDSIQSLALWIIHHKSNHEVICKLWLKRLNESSPNGKHRLALFYLANDVIQNCKRKNAKIFQDTFKKMLCEAIVLARENTVKKSVDRVIDVWLERNVYDKDFVGKLKEILHKEASSTGLQTKSPVDNEPIPPEISPSEKSIGSDKSDIEYQKIIEEFESKKLCDSLATFHNLQKEASLSKVNVEATRLLDINIEHIKQYRDKSQCANFKVEFENSCLKLEDYLSKLSKEAAERKNLIQLMEQAEIFYNAQFKDATTVANAYRIYGTKVHCVKRKLDELLVVDSKKNSHQSDAKLDSLDMEMSDEDNNEPEDIKALNKNSSSFSDSKSNSGTALKNLMDRNDQRQDSSSNNVSNRSNLDPRQNRHNNKKSSQHNEKTRHHRNSEKANVSKEDLSLSNNSPSTPLRDENSSNLNKDSSSAKQNNPLDFLTKFINKSSTNIQSPQNQSTTVNEPEPTAKGENSTNLSYLVNSLKKFVNTSATDSSTPTASAPAPIISPKGFSNKYFDPSSSFQNSFISSNQVQSVSPNSRSQRSGTPTKDETYQSTNQPPLPPTSPQFMQQAQPPPPPPPMQYHPMYQIQAPPPSTMGMMTMPPHLQCSTMPQTATSQLMVDPSFHQNFMYNQPPPQLSPLNGNSQSNYQFPNQQGKISISPNANIKSQGQFQANQSGYWITPTLDHNQNKFVPEHSQSDLSDLGPGIMDMNVDGTISNDSISNDDFQKRKFNNNNYKNFDANYGRGNGRGGMNSHYNNNFKNNNYQNKIYNKQSFNRIPTINSQRNNSHQSGYNNHNGYSDRGRGQRFNNRY